MRQTDHMGKSHVKSKSEWREENEVRTDFHMRRVCISGLESCAHKVFSHTPMPGLSTGHCSRKPSSETLHLRGSKNTHSTQSGHLTGTCSDETPFISISIST